ncbi:hypothetical protein K2173_024443 [Erythroxylum novogranatense]|uniref:TATA element modulatory factor 1 TATA binding domain-containing protein n=1 Tax=Erythroxylum novogranatense TaxID=1862640 RepID=A0AAV8SVD9_9ROSI|nr:hypothetical protein K2173_024443 [Erythroxylum novogranatense]
MAWFSGKVSLGNFPDLAGAVNKLSESVKNIEKNFDTALGLEEKPESSLTTTTTTTASTEALGLWPVMAFMGERNEEQNVESSGKGGSPQKSSMVGENESQNCSIEQNADEEKVVVVEEKSDGLEEQKNDENKAIVERKDDAIAEPDDAEIESELKSSPIDSPEPSVHGVRCFDLDGDQQWKLTSEVGAVEQLDSVEPKLGGIGVDQAEGGYVVHDESHCEVDVHERTNELKTQAQKDVEESSLVPSAVTSAGQAESLSDNHAEALTDAHAEESSDTRAEALTDAHAEESSDTRAEAEIDVSDSQPENVKETKMNHDSSLSTATPSDEAPGMVLESVSGESDALVKALVEDKQLSDPEVDTKEQRLSSGSNVTDEVDYVLELEKLKQEMKMMETALLGAARQAQAKTDEIAKLMNENENLKVVIEDLKRKSSDAEIESLREEYHQRVATLERKVYALTKERDTLRREQSRKSDAAALLKEKDEIINQVMAEGEELSKKQAAQEATMRKLRAQIRELEEEKKGLTTKLQVEENKVESIKKDKMATEKLLQETIESHQTKLAAQKEYYTNALTAAKEAEALAEARANNEARSELESRLREAEERETMLVQALEELRQTLSRKDQQAVSREEMLRRDIEDLQKRYQASERRCEELVSQVPDSTRPLIRQIEAMQETMARRTEAWSAVERSLNSRLQEAEAKAAAAEEREQSIHERLSQTLSRTNVLEAQISCLRAEQTQLSKSLEKERQRAAEHRQEYLAVKEEADTQEGRANLLQEEIKEMKRKHKEDLQESVMHRELLQQEIEREKTARLELERKARAQSTAVTDQTPLSRSNSSFENGTLSRKLSSATSLGSMEESYFLQASLDASTDSVSERRNPGEATISSYYRRNMTPSSFEAALRQKEGELASYMSRLVSMESIRDSLAEELVKMTAECEKLRSESTLLPGIRAELEALRRRHSAALELMGERDEELEELRADIVDLKEMYREQVDLLVNKIQTMGITA